MRKMKSRQPRKRRSSYSLRRRRRSNYSRRRFKPEVKYTTAVTWPFNLFGTRYLSVASAELPTSHFTRVVIYPSQGTTDTSRIGDTIHPIKIWFRISIATELSVISGSPRYSAIVRIIIFTLPGNPLTNPISQFFQAAVRNQTMDGVIDREVIKNVYYDKKHILNQNLIGQSFTRIINLNIRMKRPIVFSSGSTDPRDWSRNFYIACVPWNSGSQTSTDDVARVTCSASFYYYDN